jgi:integrase
MSVQRYETADGTQWRVRWREPDGKMRSRTVVNKRGALALDADLKARKFKGEALPRAGRETLAAAFDEWWRLRGSTLATATQRTYLAAWNAHVRGEFDHHRVGELAADPQLFEELMATLRKRGVGNAAQRKVLVVMSAVLTAAVEWGRIATNPLWRMRKPPGTRQRIPRPFPPVVVERIRVRMLRRATKDVTDTRAVADACLISVMSYCGVRPGEALALTWEDVRFRTLVIDKALSDGTVGPTKTGAVRTVPLPMLVGLDLQDLLYRQLKTELDEKLQRRPDQLVFPATGGGPWSRSEFNNWRNRVWHPILKDLASADGSLASLATARPYDCRGSFVSMHLRAGANPLEVAQWAGHSPAVMFRHYANVIEELKGEPALPVEDQIIRAREVVAEMPSEQLDGFVADLVLRPTVESGGGAAKRMYAPL